MDTKVRRAKWFFVKSGVFLLAAEHFFAMLPATLLFPIAVKGATGEDVIDMSLVLFTSGLGTLIFTFISSFFYVKTKEDGKTVKKRIRIPAYLGSSFAYIALTIYLLDTYKAEGVSTVEAYEYIGWAYIFSGVLLMLLSLIYKYERIEKLFSVLFPPAVIGPAISLIGLGLADNAVADAGVNIEENTVDLKSIFIAVCTLVAIILLSLVKKRFFKNASIIVGMFVGSVIYFFMFGFPKINFAEVDFFTTPNFNFVFPFRLPSGWPRLLISVIPSTLIVFMENMGRVTVINRMINEDNNRSALYDKKVMGRALLSHGIATVVATMMGSVPNTMYAENIAVMGIHRYKEKREEPDSFIKRLTEPFSLFPFCIAAIGAILFSFFGWFQTLLFEIPSPIIGGMELFLFGVISAPGIQLLVDQRVNYKKTSNQIITAVVLITGISELSIEYKWFELEGMSLGLVAGLVVNLIVLIIKRTGWLNDDLFIDEVLSSCVSPLPVSSNLMVEVYQNTKKVLDVPVQEMREVLSGAVEQIIIDDEKISSDFIRDIVLHSTDISVKNDTAIIKISKDVNTICIYIRKDLIDQSEISAYINDFQDAIHINKNIAGNSTNNSLDVEFLSINLLRNIPMSKVEKIIKKVSVDNAFSDSNI